MFWNFTCFELFFPTFALSISIHVTTRRKKGDRGIHTHTHTLPVMIAIQKAALLKIFYVGQRHKVAGLLKFNDKLKVNSLFTL